MKKCLVDRIRIISKSLLIFIVLLVMCSYTFQPEWGFYSHRLINRMSVFTLPVELISFYKPHIDYMTEHAVDPDKRRYASKHEGSRHYIDIDHWDKLPFPNVPRDFEEALMKYSKIRFVSGMDSVYFDKQITKDSFILSTDYFGGIRLKIDYPTMVKYWKKVIKPMYYDDVWLLSGYDLDELFGTTYFQRNKIDVIIEDHFSEYGIIPYHLEDMQKRLTKAFESNNTTLILRLSAEFGHYIGDAHVPLHTTANYNGQMTNQLGIHAFWESRIPELFAESSWDFFVGKASYVDNKKDFFWKMIIDSHSLLDSALNVEKRLSETFDKDKQFCYDDRLGRTIRIQCPEYAAAYLAEMNNMVEVRMRDAIHAIGSAIYTAWVDAGQPNIMPEASAVITPEPIIIDKSLAPRPHEEFDE